MAITVLGTGKTISGGSSKGEASAAEKRKTTSLVDRAMRRQRAIEAQNNAGNF